MSSEPYAEYLDLNLFLYEYITNPQTRRVATELHETGALRRLREAGRETEEVLETLLDEWHGTGAQLEATVQELAPPAPSGQ